MAYNGGTVIANKTKLKVFTIEGSAQEMEDGLEAAISNNDVIIAASIEGRRLTVLWYDV